MSKTKIEKEDGIKMGFEYDRDKVIKEFLPKIDESKDYHLYWDRRYNYAYFFNLNTKVMYKVSFTEVQWMKRVHYKVMKTYINQKMEWIYGASGKYYDRIYYRVYRSQIKVRKSDLSLIYTYESNMRTIINSNDKWELKKNTE